MYYLRLPKLGRQRPNCRSIGTLLLKIAILLMLTCPDWAQAGVFRVGVLTPGLNYTPVLTGLQEELAALGYKEGNNIQYIVEDTQGSTAGFAPRMAKLLAAKPDIIYVVGTASAVAAKQATATVPIVFAWVGDPIGAGLIPSYAASKNNLTGVTTYTPALTGKRLEVLLEFVPKAKRLLAIVASTENIAQSTFQQAEESARKFGFRLIRRDVKNRADIVRAIQETPKGSVDTIFYISSVLVKTNIDLLINKANKDKIPLAVSEVSLVEEGALFSYGSDLRQAGLQAAAMVEKVLKGTKPGEIVVETPNRFFLAINLATAKEIGVKISRGIMERADRLIE